MKKLMIALAFIGLGTAANAQTEIETPSKYTVATNSFWSNWFVQVGADMTLQNPYGSYDFFGDAFPNGKSFGVDVAVGKWFTPGLGLRLKANWENGLSFLINRHANWFAANTNEGGTFSPTGAVGENHQAHKGGYGMLVGDVMFNLSNMLCGYSDTRVWNFIPFLRAGINKNFAKHDNINPVLGVGIENTWRLSQHFGLYLDLAYNMTTTMGFVGQGTSGQNGTAHGYLGADLGVQFYLGKATFSKAVSIDAYNALAAQSEEALAKLRADLDRERAENARLRAELAKKPNETVKNLDNSNVVANAATSVFFDINSTKINSQKDLVNLESVASVAKNTGANVVVTGSADSQTGSDAWNQTLSEGRAQAVADELVNLGVSKDKITTVAKGGVNEVTPYPLNRRAVVELK